MILKKKERSDIHKYSIYNLQFSIPDRPDPDRLNYTIPSLVYLYEPGYHLQVNSGRKPKADWERKY